MKFYRNFKLAARDFKGFRAGFSMLVHQGKIVWIGEDRLLTRSKLKNLSRQKVTHEVDLKKKLVFPSFIECHTHALFAGSRAEEFELRNQGVSYLDIAARGGGILSTVKSVRKSSASDLLQATQRRINRFMEQGVSTVEVKSGYALDLKNEIKSLEVIQKLKGPRIVSTFLGAHAKPSEFSSHAEYLEFLADQVLPVIRRKKLSERVDIFIEKGFFEKPESQRFLQRSVEMGFQLVVHANQLTLSAGADLALQLGARSADHVIQLDQSLIQRFAESQTVAVLLPAADLYMKCPYPPARALIDAGATVALATDYNPGSCPTQDLSLVGLLARLEMKMTLPEVFRAYTQGAAKALGLQNEEGALDVGKLANFISTEADLNDFFYSAGEIPSHDLFIRGKKILKSKI